MSANYAIKVSPHKPIKKNDDAYLFIWAGTNDIANDNSSSVVYNNLKSEWSQAKAEGFKVVAFTIMPRGTLTPSQEIQRVNTNNLILSNSSLYDYLIRTDLIFPTSADTTYFYSDAVHLNYNGSNFLANYIGHNIFSNYYSQLNYLNGNIGVGTTNPTTKFQIQGGTRDKSLYLNSSGGTQSSGIYFDNTIETNGRRYNLFETTTAHTGGPGNLALYDETGGSFILYINGSAGNVGIGTTTPSQTLEIAGNVTIREMINLQLRTLPPCGTSYNGSIMRNNSGLYYCNSTQSWTLIVAG